ncbi:MAG: 2-oxo-4-hydroxy-4-carboxy-5-ureidoimidazoline decarboxylase [Chthoniobacterales bacterium]|nr:2-oxo-4-hydroxy-4-carboxy-5-ureidoimidazoline decarboxylase [Chthoniobacterales bacterium]
MTLKLAELNAAPEEEFVRAIGPVYEHSPHFARCVAGQRPFTDTEHLRHALQQEVNHAAGSEQMELIKAHPDLVGLIALTAESQSEQAAAGLMELSAEEAELFRRHNAAYREKFGFPFIICARMNKKDAILEAFPRRLQNDAAAEKKAALDEIHKIAALRLHDILWAN